MHWILERAKKRHEWLGLGEFDEASARALMEECHVIEDGKSLLCGAEMPSMGASNNALNVVVYWDTNGAAWDFLDKHESMSDLPSALFVPWKHERREALMRALRARGYEPHETLMVKHG